MGVARDAVTVQLPADRAFGLWTDLSRWPTFIDGFGHVERGDDSWPGEGAKLVWRSGPSGRGVVTERVLASEPGAQIATEVFEERLTGTQTVTFLPGEGDGSRVELVLDYELTRGGP